jgi:hypothetical protein
VWGGAVSISVKEACLRVHNTVRSIPQVTQPFLTFSLNLFSVPGYGEDGEAMSISVKEACLHAHNAVRALHEDTEPLEYDDQLAQSVSTYRARH